MKTLLSNAPVRLLAVGLLTWLIPFAVSIAFFDQNRQLVLPFVAFKVIMLIVLAVCAFVLFRWFWRDAAHERASLNAALLAGLVVFAVNIALDAFTVMPLMGLSFGACLALSCRAKAAKHL
jgi:hypothetical protein